jgi:c-di-GMP-binding flagellar brake protein YcgR
MQVKDLKVNQLIEITVDEEGTEYKNLASRIEEISEEHIHVSVPMQRGEILPLRVGLNVKVNFVLEGHSFVFTTRITDRKSNPIPVLSLAKPDRIVEIQRRMWVRVAVNIPVDFHVKGQSDKIYRGKTMDISGGGILLLCDANVSAGQILHLQINLPNRDPVFCKALVLRVIKQDTSKKELHKVVLEYQEISDGQRDKIMSFIFEKQREWIRKGLL